MDEVPFDDRHVPRVEIDWDRSAWWWYPLTRAIHPATKILALVTGLIALLLAKAGIAFGDWMFAPDWGDAVVVRAEPQVLMSSQLCESGVQLFQSLSSLNHGIRELAFVTFSALWLTLIFSILGGTIARRGLVELGQRTVAPWGESVRIVTSRWHAFLWSTGMHFVGIAVMLVPIALLGLISRLGSIGIVIAGITLLICYPIVFGVGRLAFSAVVCFPLSVCAIAAERKADAFEGFSRSNGYFFQRPIVLFICVACLLLIGLIGEQIVFWSLTLGWGLVRETYSFAGGGGQPASDTYINLGSRLKVELIHAFWFSFFWTASAAVYLVLRKSVDHTEMDQLDAPVSPIEKSLPEIPTAPPGPDASESTVATGNADS